MSTSSAASNRYILIEDLDEKKNIEDSNLIIIEDKEDTKKATVNELKKAFSGDFHDISRELYYSSAKIKELQDELLIEISKRAPESEISELRTIVNNLILSSTISGKDPEIVTARGEYSTLAERFEKEREISESSYLKSVKKSKSGTEIELDGYEGQIEVTVLSNKIETRAVNDESVIVQSKNILKVNTLSHNGNTYEKISLNNDHGFTYQQTLNLSVQDEIEIKFEVTSGYIGHYYFKASSTCDELFADKNIKLRVHHTDGTIKDYDYNHQSQLEFDTEKPFTYIGLVYSVNNIIHNTSVTFTNMMLSQYNLNEYVDYYYAAYSPRLGETFKLEANDYIFYCIDSNCFILIEYLDNRSTTEAILDRLEDIEMKLSTTVEHCELMEDYGIMQLFDSCEIISSEGSGKISDGEYDYIRNGFNSKKVTISGVGDLIVKQKLDINIEDDIKTATICFYIDKPTYDEFEANKGIEFILCSDLLVNPNMNYYSYMITKSELIQGWNTITRNIDDFSKTEYPDLYNLKSVSIKIEQNEYLEDRLIYLNMVSFNQRMKPTVIFNIEEFQETGADYLYPYLVKYNIPATIYLNGARTLENEEYNSIIGQRVAHGWDIGANSCYPNKDLLLENDNYRNQYQALKGTLLYLQENLIYNPISYSAAYGILMPITVQILKDLGFKIAKTTSTGYISTFTKKDFAIPSMLINNTVTVDEVKNRIDYMIKNGLSGAFTFRDVTEYGDEVDATKLTFESIVDYINEKVNEGKLQCVTLADFYNQCVTDL